MDELRVLVVADDPLARAGLAALLSAQPECEVVGQVGTDEELMRVEVVYRPDVVLWDLGWEPAVAFETGLQHEFSAPIVALLPDETHTIDALKAGVLGLGLRNINTDSLLATLLAASRGLLVLDPELAGAALPDGDQPSDSLVEALTPRELEVLQLLAEGLSNKAIAYQLGISDHTVKFHVNAILGKLDAQSRTEAVVRATRLGLILL